MDDFARAVNASDFSRFYENISSLWQSQISSVQLKTIFRTFSDQNIDLTVLYDMDPMYTRDPTLNSDDVLILSGYYLTQPSTTHFILKYVYESPQWKLFGINVEVK